MYVPVCKQDLRKLTVYTVLVHEDTNYSENRRIRPQRKTHSHGRVKTHWLVDNLLLEMDRRTSNKVAQELRQ